MVQSMFVSPYYEMDPQFDDLLFDGSKLKNGMVVLVEGYRYEPPADGNLKDLALARETSRWCTVSDLLIEGTMVYFIATYGDGVKKKRIYSIARAWLVKLDSI